MAIYVYRQSDGSLYSWAPNDDDQVADADTLAASGLVAVSGLMPLDATHAWDAATKSVVVVAAPVFSREVGTAKWILRFTPAEFAAISGSTDPVVLQLMYAINHTTTLDLNDPSVIQGVAYLVSVNLIDSARAAVVMA